MGGLMSEMATTPGTKTAERASTNLLSRHPWVVRRLLTVADYHRMGEVGIFLGTGRVELIEGELVAMSPAGSLHAGTVNALTRLLIDAVGNKGAVSVQNPVRLDNYSEPEPDVSVLRPRADDYRAAIPSPGDVLLVVEVAASSLRYDRAVKVPLYASHGIPEFWIVDVAGREIEVLRKPEGDRYADVTCVGVGDMLEPSLLPGAYVSVAAVLG